MDSGSLNVSDFDDSGEASGSHSPRQRSPSPTRLRPPSPSQQVSPGPSQQRPPGPSRQVSPGPSRQVSPGPSQHRSPGPVQQRAPAAGYSPDISDFTPGSIELENPQVSTDSPTVAPSSSRGSGLFVPDTNALLPLMQQESARPLKFFINEHYHKIAGYQYLVERLCHAIKKYGPPTWHVEPHHNIAMIVDSLEKLLEESQKKWALFDVKMEDLGLLKGSILSTLVEKSKNRVSEVLDRAEQRVGEYKDMMLMMEFQMMETEELLQAKLERAQRRLQDLRGERLRDDVPEEAEFQEGLLMELSMQENMNSSLKESNYRLRKSNEELLVDLNELNEQLNYEHQERLKELAEVAKAMELNEEIRGAVIEKIQGLTANPDEITRAVNDWMNAINEAIEGKKTLLQGLNLKARKLDDELAAKRSVIDDLEDENESLADCSNQLEMIKEDFRAKQEQCAFFEYSIKSLSDRAKVLEQKNLQLAAKDDRLSKEHFRTFRTAARTERAPVPGPSISPGRIQQTFGHPYGNVNWPLQQWKHDPYFQMTTLWEDSAEEGSPERFQTGQPYLASSPGAGSPSPFPHPAASPVLSGSSFHAQDYPATFAVETQTSPGPSSGITNRVDAGTSFDMQTEQSGFPSPYIHPLESPQAGPSRVTDSPLHAGQFTPNQYRTPSISRMSRFGYTDRTSRVLNVPPGPFQRASALQKTVVLTSPKRQEPLLVNIDVDPKPLTETESGEHFVCDISLNVQPADPKRYGDTDFRQYENLSPVYTFSEPPAVTPTSTRRHGLFTPRGIFKRKHYNLRRVYKPYEYQTPNLPWSPHGLPDIHSPLLRLNSPRNISDSTISWEKVPESPFGSPVMDRTYNAYSPPPMSRTFERSPSPAIKGPYYGMSPGSDTTNYSTPSPRFHREFDRSSSPGYDRTFDRSPSPMIKGPSYTMRSPRLNRTYERSPSPVIKRPSFRMRRPRPDRTYERSPSPVLDRTYNKSSPDTERSFDRSVDSLGQPGPLPLNITYGSPQMNQTYSRSPSPDLNGTYEIPGQPGSPLDSTGSFYASSPSPQLNRTYGSPQMNQTFSRSPSPHLNRTYNNPGQPGSPLDSTGSFYASSPSPQLNRTYGSPQMNQTFSRSPSPHLNSASESPNYQ